MSTLHNNCNICKDRIGSPKRGADVGLSSAPFWGYYTHRVKTRTYTYLYFYLHVQSSKRAKYGTFTHLKSALLLAAQGRQISYDGPDVKAKVPSTDVTQKFQN